MASFANIEDCVVVNTVEVNDNQIPDEDAGIAFLQEILGGEWAQMYGSRGHASVGWRWQPDSSLVDGGKFLPPSFTE